MCGWQVKLCDPLVTHGPFLSALEVQHDKALYKSTFTLLYFTLLMGDALRANIDSKSAFFKGVGQFGPKFQVGSDIPHQPFVHR